MVNETETIEEKEQFRRATPFSQAYTSQVDILAGKLSKLYSRDLLTNPYVMPKMYQESAHSALQILSHLVIITSLNCK